MTEFKNIFYCGDTWNSGNIYNVNDEFIIMAVADRMFSKLKIEIVHNFCNCSVENLDFFQHYCL